MSQEAGVPQQPMKSSRTVNTFCSFSLQNHNTRTDSQLVMVIVCRICLFYLGGAVVQWLALFFSPGTPPTDSGGCPSLSVGPEMNW